METTVEIDSLAQGGDGVARIEGQVCFVRRGLPGDTLRVRVTRTTKRALWAEIVEVLKPSPDRIASKETKDGTCTWGHFAYPAQGEWKLRIVRDTLARLGGIETTPEWCENESLRWGYRTRAEFHGDGEHLGFYEQGSHDIVDMDSSPLCHEKLNAALRILRDIGIKGTVTVTVNPEGEEVLVWTKFPKRKLKQYFPLANSASDEIPRARFFFDDVPVVNGSFSQSSLLLNRMLTRTTHDMIGKVSSLLDLYCGNGNLSLGLAERCAVTGFDHSRVGVQAARATKKGDYRTGGEDKMRALIQKGEHDTILLDPPRVGAKDIMPALGKCSAHTIVYVSCDPATLARDLKILTAQGWGLTRSTVVDMFPQTPHIETVCRLERVEGRAGHAAD